MTKCNVCGKVVCSKGLAGHTWRVHGEGVDHKPRKGTKAWNRGLTKNTDPRVAAYTKTLQQTLDSNNRRPLTEEQLRQKKENLSKLAKERSLGGHTSKKRVFFKRKDGEIIYLQSSYEEKFANILEELDIVWERPKPFVWVDENGDNHRYYPDFKIGEIFIDTKNDYLAKKDLPKIEKVRIQNNIDLRIFTFEMITKENIALLV